MTSMRGLVVASLLSCIGATGALADSPIQLALWPPDMQLVDEDQSIRGLRLNVYGSNQDVTGVDIGFVHETMGDFKGVAFGLASIVEGALTGVQMTWLYSKAGPASVGWQSSLYNKAGGDFTGLQAGALNLNDGATKGLQIAFLYNYVADHMNGGQIALVNRAASIDGVQIGLVNLADQMNGLQLGLWNQIDGKESLTVLPIVNWNF